MDTNCTFNSIKPLKYGYDFIGNTKTFKNRFTTGNANRLIEALSQEKHELVTVFNTSKGYTFLVIMAHYSDTVWTQLEAGINMLHKDKIWIKIDKKKERATKLMQEAQALAFQLSMF